MKRFRIIPLLVLIIIFGSGCVYFNTFYYARKNFNSAESKRKNAEKKGQITSYTTLYKTALDKSQKILDKYPKSSWYDDALYINGVSNYYTEDYNKSEKRFRELIADFPKSKYVKEARLYLAKAKLKMGEEADAMNLFENLFIEGKDKDIKAEAAKALGEYYFEQKVYDSSERYFQALVDSLGDDQDKVMGQMSIADGYYARFKYKHALEGYQKVLKRQVDLSDEYKATYRAGECCFYLHQIEDGMAYLDKLSSNQLFYDSLSAIKLLVAFGYQLDGDLARAEATYQDVAMQNQRMAGAEANYNLGLIYQFDYEDYKKAKEYYDKAKGAGGGTAIYQDALQRSSDIGKLEEYSKTRTLDSTVKPEVYDSAAKTQYLLAELYLTQLGKPDSAFHEFQVISEKFSNTFLAPKALIATAIMQRDFYNDTLAFDSTLRRVLRIYPKSDYLPEAIGLLGLAGTAADTGYAGYYYRKGEQYALDSSKVDSARYYFKLVADSFPNSIINNQAKFAILWLTENYQNPEDSTLYYAYANFADSFPNTEYGQIAGKKLVIKPKLARPSGDSTVTDSSGAVLAVNDSTPDSTRALSGVEKYYIDPDGKKIYNLDQTPLKVDKEFKYPPSAYITKFEGILYFQIKVDPFGDVADLKLMTPTQSEELNQEVTEVVQLSHFSTHTIPPELLNTWFVYKYTVTLPKGAR